MATQRSGTTTTTVVEEDDFPTTGWQRAPSVEKAVREEAALVIEAWVAFGTGGRRWLVTSGKGPKGESYINATVKKGGPHQYLSQDVAARILEAARKCAN